MDCTNLPQATLQACQDVIGCANQNMLIQIAREKHDLLGAIMLGAGLMFGLMMLFRIFFSKKHQEESEVTTEEVEAVLGKKRYKKVLKMQKKEESSEKEEVDAKEKTNKDQAEDTEE